MIVQLFVDRADEDLNVRMSLLNRSNTFRRTDEVHQLDVLDAAALEAVDRSDSGAAGRQHRVEQQNVAVLDVTRQLAVILDRLEGLRVAIQADVADLGCRDHLQNTLYHAETCAQDRNESDLLAGELTLGNRGLDGDLLERQITGRLVAHQHGDLGSGLAEFLDAGGLVAHQAQLVLDQRVVHFMYGCHNRSLLLLKSEFVICSPRDASCVRVRPADGADRRRRAPAGCRFCPHE